MRKHSVIVCFVALIFSACGTVSTIPIDDAYHWPEKSTPVELSSPAQVENPETSESPSPVIEYLNVQDTVVTIRIKK